MRRTGPVRESLGGSIGESRHGPSDRGEAPAPPLGRSRESAAHRASRPRVPHGVRRHGKEGRASSIRLCQRVPSTSELSHRDGDGVRVEPFVPSVPLGGEVPSPSIHRDVARRARRRGIRHHVVYAHETGGRASEPHAVRKEATGTGRTDDAASAKGGGDGDGRGGRRLGQDNVRSESGGGRQVRSEARGGVRDHVGTATTTNARLCAIGVADRHGFSQRRTARRLDVRERRGGGQRPRWQRQRHRHRRRRRRRPFLPHGSHHGIGGATHQAGDTSFHVRLRRRVPRLAPDRGGERRHFGRFDLVRDYGIVEDGEALVRSVVSAPDDVGAAEAGRGGGGMRGTADSFGTERRTEWGVRRGGRGKGGGQSD
mmetsp:Transcript_43787/g.133254  ORF Transcript_43787/g.133254 Transcript_43787/m.133254 type:complete len:370 (+) Transcript_43787:833-1942(+)